MTRIGFRHDRVRVALRQFRARSKHASPDEIESRAGNQPANDAAGARFAHRVRRHNDVGELFSLHFDYLSGGIRVPQNSSPKDSRESSPIAHTKFGLAGIFWRSYTANLIYSRSTAC